jgi:multidrug efflux pump subunit AcrB
MLTSLTTFVGLVPVMMESSTQAQFVIPMAISLAWGVLVATVFTLFLIPAAMLVAEDVKHLWQSLWRRVIDLAGEPGLS